MASKYLTQEMMSSLSLDEIISLHVSRVMDALGYSRRMAQYRRDSYQEQDRMTNMMEPYRRILTSGSKGEGLTKPWESDEDVLCIDRTVVCTEEDMVRFAPQDVSVFTFSPEYLHPGYNLLSFHSLGTRFDSCVPHSLVPSTSGRPLLSSDKHAEHKATWLRNNPGLSTVHGRVGPATTHSLLKHDWDKVFSLPSVSPSVLQEWLHRPRQYEWPPLDLRLRISKMNGNFVAKGCKHSRIQCHEWRQCFNEAELVLVHSWDDTLMKLYVLLKVILKEILRPLDKDKFINSYVMKNIVFWLAETNPTDDFQDKYLLKLLFRALRMLQVSIEDQFLPYYMIPRRNLLGDDVLEPVKRRLLKCIKRLLREGPSLLHKLRKFKFTKEMCHSELFGFSDQRDEMEMIFLSHLISTKRLCNQGVPVEQMINDETQWALDRRYKELAYSHWPPHIQEKFEWCENLADRLAVILR